MTFVRVNNGPTIFNLLQKETKKDHENIEHSTGS